jgi:hypothetical protein
MINLPRKQAQLETMDASQAALATAAAAATLCYCAAGDSDASAKAGAAADSSTTAAAAAAPAGSAASSAAAAGGGAGRRLVIVGTGAERDKEDAHKWVGLSSILLYSLGSDGSLIQESELPDVGVNPMFMCSDDAGRLLYAVNMGAKENTASLQTYAVDQAARTLTKLGETRTADGPCHISTVAKDARDVFGAPCVNRFVFAVNYGAGRVAVHPARADGTLGPPTCTIEHGPGASAGGPPSAAALCTLCHSHSILESPVLSDAPLLC